MLGACWPAHRDVWTAVLPLSGGGAGDGKARRQRHLGLSHPEQPLHQAGIRDDRRRGGRLSMLSPASATGGNWVSPARTTAARSSAPGPSLVFSLIRVLSGALHASRPGALSEHRSSMQASRSMAPEKARSTCPPTSRTTPFRRPVGLWETSRTISIQFHLRPGVGGAAHAKRVVRRAVRHGAWLSSRPAPHRGTSPSRVSHDPTLRYTCILSVVSPEAICSGGYSRSRGRRRS